MHVFTPLRGFGAPVRKVSYAAVDLSPPGDVQVITRPRPTNPPPTAVPDTRAQCDAIWNTLIASSTPSIRTCLTGNPQHKGYYNNVCVRLALGQTSARSAAGEWADYVTRNCAAPPSTARVPRHVTTPTRVRPPTTPGPTSTPSTPGGSITIPPGDDNDSGNPPTSSGGSPGGDMDGDDQDKKGFLRQMGGVVGVGLLVAVGLTVARDKKFMRKLTGKRARR